MQFQKLKNIKKLYEAGATAEVEWKQKVKEADSLKKQIDVKKINIENEKLSQKQNDNSISYQIEESKGDYQNKKGTVEENKQNYETAIKNLESARNQRTEKLYEMKQQYLEELKQYDVQIAEQYNQYENKDIIAPFDGIVKSLEIEKEGAVVAATQLVAEIIPDSDVEIVEAEILNSDIGYVEVGQDTDIKVDTYDYQKYGKLHGTVVYVSPDATENEQMQKVYKAKIALTEDKDRQWEISQGMQCTVEIKTDQRHIIEFFLEPLTDALDRGLRER